MSKRIAKPQLARWVALTAICFILAVTVEVGLRLCFGLGHPALVYREPTYSYAFMPNQSMVRFGHRIRYNHQGLRSEELDARPKVLCLGDSVTNGGSATNQDDTYPYLVEASLNKHGKNVQVLNASAGGWALANEFAFLSRWGTYGARVVVLEIGTNDFYQNKADASFVGVDPNFPDSNPTFGSEELVTRYLWPRVRSALSREAGAPRPPLAKDSLYRNIGIIEGMMNYARSNGASVILLLTPDREEIETNPEYVRLRESADETGREAIGNLCKKHGVQLIDTRRQFASHWIPNPFRDAVHPNEFGNRIIAQALIGSLLDSF